MNNFKGRLKELFAKQITDNFELEEIANAYGIKNFEVMNKDFPLKKLQKNHFNYILNQDDPHGAGTHWVALKGRIENGVKKITYVDSYGFPAPQQLVDHIKKLKAPASAASYLSHQIQPISSERCGFYAILSLLISHMDELLDFEVLDMKPNNYVGDNDKILWNKLVSLDKKNGGGFVDNVINALPFEAHLYSNPANTSSLNVKKMNFAGPGTMLVPSDPRLKGDETKSRTSGPPDYKIKPWSIPINKLDEGAYYHDIAYDKFKDRDGRRLADRKLAEVAKSVSEDKKETYLNRAVAKVVEKVMNHL